ncbi:hypothetical protein LCGC14_2696880, partial [marine sediment metagenome]
MPLAVRVILCLTLNEGQLSRTKRFRPDRWYTLNFVDMEEADEIVLLAVTREPSEAAQMAFHDTVRQFSEQLFLPLSVGGHISDLAGVHNLFAVGADKVVINTHAFRHPEFITQIAHKYGSQAVCVSIDVKDWHVWIDRGSEDTGMHVLEWAREAVSRGAGELLLMDMDRDGSLEGYNLELTRAVAGALTVPVVAVGGCGNWSHMVEVIRDGHASACATAAFFTLPSRAFWLPRATWARLDCRCGHDPLPHLSNARHAPAHRLYRWGVQRLLVSRGQEGDRLG